jgi:hypothetical protein
MIPMRTTREAGTSIWILLAVLIPLTLRLRGPADLALDRKMALSHRSLKS